MDPRNTVSGRAADRSRRSGRSRRRPPAAVRRPGLWLGMAAAGAVLVNVLVGADPAAQAEAGAAEPVSVAQQLGMTADSRPAGATQDLRPLEQLSASRDAREAEEAAAAQAQAVADQAAVERRQAEDAARAAAEAAAAAEAEKAAAAAAAQQEAAEAAEAAAQERARSAAAPPAAATVKAATAAGATARISNSSGGVKPQAQAAANMVVSNVPGASGITIGGTRPSATDPDGHPSGLALDYMVNSDSALGDAIVAYHIAHWDELGVEYVIWEQRMLSSPSGAWKKMEDRGSATANHMDHPHVNYLG